MPTEYVGHFAEFLQTANFVVHCRANRNSPKQKLNTDGTVQTDVNRN